MKNQSQQKLLNLFQPNLFVEKLLMNEEIVSESNKMLCFVLCSEMSLKISIWATVVNWIRGELVLSFNNSSFIQHNLMSAN